MNNQKRDFYIYNFEQAKFFIEHGLVPIKIGKGTKGHIFHLFKRDEQSEKVFTLWCNNKK